MSKRIKRGYTLINILIFKSKQHFEKFENLKQAVKFREGKGRRNIIFLKQFFFRFRLSLLLQVLIAKIRLLQRKPKRKVCLTHFLNLKFPGETVQTSGKGKVLR